MNIESDLYAQHSKTDNFYMVLISSNQSFISQILRAIDPSGETFDFLSVLGVRIQRDSDFGATGIKLH